MLMDKTHAMGQGRYRYGTASRWVATFLVLNCTSALAQADPPFTLAEATAKLEAAGADFTQAGQDLQSAKDALAEIPADCATALQKLGNALIKLGSAKGKLQEVASRMPQGLTVAQVAALSNALTSGIGAADAGIAEVQTKLDECTGGRAQGRAEECCDDTGIDAIIQRVEDGSGHVADALALLASIVPTVSEWGLIVMALVVLTAGTVVLGRRRRATAA